ncbi:MAG: xanthine dehydrogenase family protein molybdopterin-binding subunit [Pseudomonadota bacterium]
MKHVGRSLERLDARRHVTGQTVFAGDVAAPRETALRVVRSPVAFGRIVDIDAAAARAVPGVIAILTAQDLTLPPVATRLMPSEVMDAYCQPVLAADMVRYAGEPVVAIIAETAAIAEDAAELVVLDIEADTPLLDATASASVLSGDLRSTEAATVRKAFGDLNRAFDSADAIVERTLTLSRTGALPLEPRSSLAVWDKGRQALTMHLSTRALTENRNILARALDLPEAAVVVAGAPTGGNFGAWDELLPEDFLCAHASKLLSRPVRWVEDRADQLSAAPQARGVTATARAAITRAGALLGLDVEFFLDQGAYLRPEGLLTADVLAAFLPGPYAMDAYRVVGHVRMTNKVPAGRTRGAGRMEATFIRERLIDAVAARCGLTPFAMREKLVVGDTRPAERHVDALKSRVSLDCVPLKPFLQMAHKRFSLELLERRAADRRASGEVAGVGLALFLEPSGLGAFEHATISADARGDVEVVIGPVLAAPGTDTVIAQVVADIVGVDYTRVRVTAGRSERMAHSGPALLGGGTVLTLTAAQYAAEALRDKILDAAGRILAVPAERLAIRSGRIREADRHFGNALEVGDVARAVAPGGRLAEGGGQGLFAEGWAHGAGMTVPAGLAVATVTIDKVTGHVRAPKVMVAFDAGNVLNPQLAEAQVVGGAVQGTAGALSLALTLDDEGRPRAKTLAEAGMPTAAERPQVEVHFVEEPSEHTPLGARSVGAAGLVGVGAAIAAAVDDALGTATATTALPLSRSDILARIGEGRVAPPASVSEPA